MNEVMKRILVCLLTFIPAVAGADKIWNSGKGTTWDCKKDPVVVINHGKGTYKLKGACTRLNVNGGNLKITADAIDDVFVNGSKNEITVGAVASLSVTGSKNKITWKTAKTGDAPSISNIGKDNAIAQAGGPATTTTPPPATAAAPKQDAPATGGGSVIDCGKSPSFLFAENDGVFTFTGKCDTIAISGNDNKLKIESVKTLALSGNENTAEVTAVSTISTSGNDNRVTYKGALTATAKTKISNTGNGNKISTIQ